jgi:hypothetical protein
MQRKMPSSLECYQSIPCPERTSSFFLCATNLRSSTLESVVTRRRLDQRNHSRARIKKVSNFVRFS